MVETGRRWFERLAPDGDMGEAVPSCVWGEDEQEARAEDRREVMRRWRDFEDSRMGVWLSRHTRLLERLSDEESLVVRHTGGVVVLLAVLVALMSAVACGGFTLLAVLAVLPWLVAAYAACLLLFMFWDSYKDSPERSADWLSTRPGIATWRQIADRYGPRAIMRDVVPAVLPLMLAAWRADEPDALMPRPWHAGVFVGYSQHMEIWLSAERHIYILGPTRSGKTVCIVIPAVVEAPGFVLATSTRGDIIKATRRLRELGVIDRQTGAKYGGISGACTHIFDPEGVADLDVETRHNMYWTPLQGCDDPSVAMRRAQTLVGIGGLGQGSNNAEWGVSAAQYVQALLYAAAISDRTIGDCYRWSLSPEKAQEAAELIKQHAPQRDMDLWADILNALPHVDPRQSGSEWFGVKNAFTILADPKVRARMDFSPSDPRLINPKDMVRRGDTVYVLSQPKREGGAGNNAGVFVCLLLDTFQEACQQLAFDPVSGARGKIEPPARFVLDELSNIEVWSGLRNMITQGGGNGAQVLLVQQSRQQMADEANGYGRAVEQTVWDNCHHVMLNGVGDRETLDQWVDLVGRHGTTRREANWNPGQGLFGGFSTRHEREETVTKRELGLLPRGWAMVQPLGEAPALTHTVQFMRRGWWRPDRRADRVRVERGRA